MALEPALSVRLSVSALDTPLLYADSLVDNVLCGVKNRQGTYTSKGITKLSDPRI